jgi:hypothetical protein
MQLRLSRRSDFRPTRIKGVEGQKWVTSGAHFLCHHVSLEFVGFLWRVGDEEG